MLNIVTYDDDKLRKKSSIVENIDDKIIKLINDMQEAMYYYNGIGLAAIQVGIPLRLFVADVPKSKQIVMINPKIVEFSSKTSLFDEGCLSIPGVLAEVERPATITVEYLDLDGKTKNLNARGLLATCIQHEFDHLDGLLFIDRLTPEIKTAKIKEYFELIKKYL